MVRPGMQIYDPDPPVRRSSMDARGAIAAAVLGMQATPPLMYGLSAVLLGSMLGDEFNEFGSIGGSSAGDIGSFFTLIGVLTLLVGLLCVAGSIGIGIRRGWGRTCAIVVEIIGLLAIGAMIVQSGAIGPVFFAIPPALVLGLLARDESYG